LEPGRTVVAKSPLLPGIVRLAAAWHAGEKP